MTFYIYSARADWPFLRECIYQTNDESTAADYVDMKNSQLAEKGLNATWFYESGEDSK